LAVIPTEQLLLSKDNEIAHHTQSFSHLLNYFSKFGRNLLLSQRLQ